MRIKPNLHHIAAGLALAGIFMLQAAPAQAQGQTAPQTRFTVTLASILLSLRTDTITLGTVNAGGAQNSQPDSGLVPGNPQEIQVMNDGLTEIVVSFAGSNGFRVQGTVPNSWLLTEAAVGASRFRWGFDGAAAPSGTFTFLEGPGPAAGLGEFGTPIAATGNLVANASRNFPWRFEAPNSSLVEGQVSFDLVVTGAAP